MSHVNIWWSMLFYCNTQIWKSKGEKTFNDFTCDCLFSCLCWLTGSSTIFRHVSLISLCEEAISTITLITILTPKSSILFLCYVKAFYWCSHLMIFNGRVFSLLFYWKWFKAVENQNFLSFVTFGLDLSKYGFEFYERVRVWGWGIQVWSQISHSLSHLSTQRITNLISRAYPKKHGIIMIDTSLDFNIWNLFQPLNKFKLFHD